MNQPLLPPWPDKPLQHSSVALREVRASDLAMARELATDPYVPLVGSLPADADEAEAGAWIARQQNRYAEGTGFSFTITATHSGEAVGHCGLWLRELEQGRATIGYSVRPSSRGRGYAGAALIALTEFAWSVPGLRRVALYIEPWNGASIRTAERAGYTREGLLRSHQMIGGEPRDMLLYASIKLEHSRPRGQAVR